MLDLLRRVAARSDLFAFNVVRRDRWVAARARELPAGTKVLDVGAGSAPYRHLFGHCDYRTQDLVPLKPEQLRFGGYSDIDYVSDATAIPAPDASFDCILCTEMLEHHPDPIGVIHEMARLLGSGGRVILTAPLGSGLHQEPYHFYGGFTPWWYRQFLGEAGFDSIEIEANEGSFRYFSQESIRFARTTIPFRHLPMLVSLAWLPFWLLLLPWLCLLIPLAASVLDRYDRERRFTIGYHVTAVRSDREDPASGRAAP